MPYEDGYYFTIDNASRALARYDEWRACRFIESTDSTRLQKHTPIWKPAVPPASWSSSRRTTTGQPVSIRA
jgi:hypothetical protein